MQDELKPLNPWPLLGYAPGNYQCHCVLCKRDFEGDKRAINCLECAVTIAKAKATRPVTEEAVEAAAIALAESFGDDFNYLPKTEADADLTMFPSQEQYREHARAALSAGTVPGVVEVKKLEWDGRNANTPFGTYTISYPAENSGVTLVFEGGAVGEFVFPNENEAKAAAQADFAKRIRSALTGGEQ